MFESILIEKRQEEVIAELRRNKVDGIEGYTRKLISATNQSDHLDILAEGRFAVFLLRKGFASLRMEPFLKGPAIWAKFADHDVFFEVKRRRPNEEDSRLLETAGPFWYEKPETVNDIISVKLRQLREDEPNALVIWSDTISLGIPEIQEAFKHIRQEKDEHMYRNLSAILLVEDSRIDLAVPGHCALEHNPDAAKPLPASVSLALTSL